MVFKSRYPRLLTSADNAILFIIVRRTFSEFRRATLLRNREVLEYLGDLGELLI